MSRIPLSAVGSTPLERVMGHAPHALTPWLQLEDAFYSRQLFAQDHKGISESQLAVMKQHFTDAELVELVSFMGFMWATGTFGSVLGVKAKSAYDASH